MSRPRLPLSKLTCIVLTFLPALIGGGCALFHPARKPAAVPAPKSPPAPCASPTPSPSPRQGLLSHILHPFAPRPSPPKAQALRKIGVIRTLSSQEHYVIVELEPGLTVSPGSELFVTGAGGEPARLKVDEVQLPYFTADVKGGDPSPGDIVQQ